MATIGVAGESGVVQGIGDALVLSDVGDKTDFFLIKHIITAVEHLGSLVRRLQEIAQRWHGAVMEVGRPCPDAVEWVIRIALSLTKVREAVARIRIEGVLIHRESIRVREPTVRVGTDVFEPYNMPNLGALRSALDMSVAECMISMA